MPLPDCYQTERMGCADEKIAKCQKNTLNLVIEQFWYIRDSLCLRKAYNLFVISDIKWTRNCVKGSWCPVCLVAHL